MKPSNDIRDRLLLHLPDPRDLNQYRSDVAATIAKNQKKMRLEKVLANSFWIFCAALATSYIWFRNDGSQFPRAPFLACIWLLVGGVELLKHHIRSARVELQKGIKQLQVQVLELQAALLKSDKS